MNLFFNININKLCDLFYINKLTNTLSSTQHNTIH